MKRIAIIPVLLMGLSVLAEGSLVATPQKDELFGGFNFLGPVSLKDGASTRESSIGYNMIFGVTKVSENRDRWSLVLEGFQFIANQSEPNRIDQWTVVGGLPMFRWYYKEVKGLSCYAQGGIGALSLAREKYNTQRSSYIGMMTKLGVGITAPIIFENLRATIEWSQVFGPNSLDFSYPSFGLSLQFDPKNL